MLLEWAKTKEGKEKADRLLQSFSFNGTKGITPENFLNAPDKKHYSYYHYTFRKGKYLRHFRGFFSDSQERDLYCILDYYEGRIITIN